MVDFHNHLLPGMDDGSQNKETTSKIIQMLKEQGVYTVVATPHAYAYNETVESFLLRRGQAYETIEDIIPDGFNVILGAEVAFESGMLDIPDVEKLCVSGTNRILIELPRREIGFDFCEEILNFCYSKNVKPVFAHIERYPVCRNYDMLKALHDIDGAVFQITSDTVNTFRMKKIMKKYVEWGFDFIIASDAHGSVFRVPAFNKAESVLDRHFGKGKKEEIFSLSEKLLLDK